MVAAGGRRPPEKGGPGGRLLRPSPHAVTARLRRRQRSRPRSCPVAQRARLLHPRAPPPRRGSPPFGRGPVGGESIACRGRALRPGARGGAGLEPAARRRGPGAARRAVRGGRPPRGALWAALCFRQEAQRAPGEAGGGGGEAAATLGAGSAGRGGPAGGDPGSRSARGLRRFPSGRAAGPRPPREAAAPSPASAAAPRRPPRTRRRRRAEPGPARRDAAPPGAAEPAPRLPRARSGAALGPRGAGASALRGCGKSALLARQLCSPGAPRGREAVRAGFPAAPSAPSLPGAWSRASAPLAAGALLGRVPPSRSTAGTGSGESVLTDRMDGWSRTAGPPYRAFQTGVGSSLLGL